MAKIIKHAREAPSTTAHGLLLGLDLEGTLEISNSFPLPHHSDDGDKSTKTIGMHGHYKALPRMTLFDSTISGIYASIIKGGAGRRQCSWILPGHDAGSIFQSDFD